MRYETAAETKELLVLELQESESDMQIYFSPMHCLDKASQGKGLKAALVGS